MSGFTPPARKLLPKTAKHWPDSPEKCWALTPETADSPRRCS
jgi:hypothetical protein